MQIINRPNYSIHRQVPKVKVPFGQTANEPWPLDQIKAFLNKKLKSIIAKHAIPAFNSAEALATYISTKPGAVNYQTALAHAKKEKFPTEAFSEVAVGGFIDGGPNRPECSITTFTDEQRDEVEAALRQDSDFQTEEPEGFSAGGWLIFVETIKDSIPTIDG